jgi:redox-sensitive bicupin YhaK (pirin superfamily)
MQLTVITSDSRENRDFGWLQTHWLFSFDDYFDPDNVDFGVLRVFNDDLIAPGKGFPAHRHSEMEIVTMVLEGRLAHRDSAGNQRFLGPGEVQRMTAGTGVLHSEMNEGKGPVHMYQMWFIPDRGGLKPSYQQRRFPFFEKPNALVPIVSKEGVDGSLMINSPATLYGCMLESGQRIALDAPGHILFAYMTSGGLEANGTKLGQGDQLRCTANGTLEFKADVDSKFVLVDMPEGV